MSDLERKLELFRDMEISRLELEQILGCDVYNLKSIVTVMVENVHVIKVLAQYGTGTVSKDRLVEWVNVVWFSGAFEYSAEHQESIASVMNELEELDEDNVELTQDDIDKYILALTTNSAI